MKRFTTDHQHRKRRVEKQACKSQIAPRYNGAISTFSLNRCSMPERVDLLVCPFFAPVRRGWIVLFWSRTLQLLEFGRSILG